MFLIPSRGQYYIWVEAEQGTRRMAGDKIGERNNLQGQRNVEFNVSLEKFP